MSVDKRSRKAMADYLKDHFRYDTMSSWNRSTSYAAKVKVHTFVPNELLNRAFDLIGMSEPYDAINDIISDWTMEQDYQYQAGFNGRSSGYIVMYQGGKKPLTYKSVCPFCGIHTNYEVDHECMRCHAGNLIQPWAKFETFSYPGKSIDMGETFEYWSIDDLRERVKLVESFDAMVERCKEEFLQMCKDFKVEEKEIMVPTKVKVLVEA
jgi:hypothetical protein